MKLEFKTDRDVNGNRRYLAFDTDRKVFTTLCPNMITGGFKMSRRDLKDMEDYLKNNGFTYQERI